MSDFKTLFGPAGNSESFAAMGYRKTLQVPEYLTRMGLDAFEYQCGRGVNISQEKAAEFGAACREKGIYVSLHAPYYISLSSVEEEKRLNSINYILQSARAVNWMGGERIVVHSGSCSKISREEALALAVDTMKLAQKALDEEGLSNVHICPEVMGKINQLGTLEEVMELCSVDERIIPCVDFGHLNARTFGSLKSAEDFGRALDIIQNRLGMERAKRFHIHFSKILYTEKGGEKCHLTFEDQEYGPNFEPLAEEMAKRGMTPVVICESAGTQAEDAAAMKAIWNSIKEG
ncbi:MAG: TIM barrel protein [Oscillospiraceae bacterium]|nr:TIM barrel protein [Oscillospiraceae bacterium]